MTGEYSVLITGPKGVAMSAVLNLEERRHAPMSLEVDDERLPELLVITSILGGCVEGELVKGRETAC